MWSLVREGFEQAFREHPGVRAILESQLEEVEARILGRESGADPAPRVGRLERMFGGAPRKIAAFVAWLNQSTSRRLITVVGLTAISLIGSWLLMPKAEYLPAGNRNLVFGVIIPPPGARVLAGNAHDPHQALAVSEHAWSTQFHPELNAQAIEKRIGFPEVQSQIAQLVFFRS